MTGLHQDCTSLRSRPPPPIQLGRELTAGPAHYVLHMALPCACDKAITAKRCLWDLTSPHPHGPQHLLFNLTQCSGKYSRNGQSNDGS